MDFELLQTSETRKFGAHWYPTASGPSVAGVLISCLSNTDDSVLDPFCGTGTVLIEARRQNRRPLGGDLNPVAGLVTRARLASLDPDLWKTYRTALGTRIVEIELGAIATDGDLEALVPAYSQNCGWYHKSTLRELAVVWQAIRTIDHKYQHVAEMAFSGILRGVSSSRGSADRIADNVRPNTLFYRPVISRFLSNLAAYLEPYNRADTPACVDDSPIWVGTSERHLTNLATASVDLFVTQLPELGVADYLRSQRLTAMWFGWDIADYETDELGARFKRRRRGAAAEYLDPLERLFSQVARVVKDDGWGAIILGQRTDRIGLRQKICDALETGGFTVCATLDGARTRRAERPGRQTIVIVRRQ
ncbi:DNA methyltransferase [Phytohabitans aurantiacus]|uniref:DNA methyltransferase n=1 Tax=Phytohabitans aurantiacus TaxID=3016789 RepID=UPI0024930CA4|nr:DNA methyltransferase [Phytohabitans aurantiacus]